MFTALSKVLGFFLNEEDEMPESEDTTFQPDRGDFKFNIAQNKFNELFFFQILINVLIIRYNDMYFLI